MEDNKLNLSKYVNFHTLKTVLIIMSIYCLISPMNINAQGFDTINPINDLLNSTKGSGAKPQSKVWKYLDKWYAVIPVAASGADAAGTWLWRLDTDTWTKLIILSTSTTSQADCVVDGSFTHILLYDGVNSNFVTLEYVSGSYQIWSSGPGLVSVTLELADETATIDIDSNKRIWLSYDDTSTDIIVKYSDSPYNTWNGPIVLETSAIKDDICTLTAFGGNKIGVFWSNQTTREFGFAYHVDGDPTSVSNWTFETAIQVSSPGLGVADDHMNIAVHSDGTIYVAVKTGYNTVGVVQVGLLVRNTSGVWNFYDVRYRNGSVPTRPLALLNETQGTITVVFLQGQGGDDVMYKSSFISSISFSPGTMATKLISDNPTDGGYGWDDITSTKQSFNPDVVVLASDNTSNRWRGKWTGYSPLPVELAYFAGNLNGNEVELRWRTETEVNNYGFEILRKTQNDEWSLLGFVEGHGNSNSPKQYNFYDSEINESGIYSYRLKQIDNDGTYEYSEVVNVEVVSPGTYNLSQNYPNPFNPATRIDFTLPEKQLVTIRVYNTLGEQVRELINEEREAGSYSLSFDGSYLPSGIYFYTIYTDKFTTSKKMTLLK